MNARDVNRSELRHPLYVCPRDRSILRMSADSGFCAACGASYPVEANILRIDWVRRRDREAFDPAAASLERLRPEQLAAGARRAEEFLKRVEIERLQGATFLDLGCGFGDLTAGLSSSDRVEDSDIYSIDHSVGSLRVLLQSVSTRHGNRVHVSAQDASGLCFPDSSFDFVFGSAVLHHVLDYKVLLSDVLRILKPEGKAVFLEPFLDGYFLVSLLLNLAVDHMSLTDSDLKQPEFGMCRFILDDISYRAQHRNDLAALDHLVDKHLFREDCIEIGHSLGFRCVSLSNSEPPEFYAGFMDVFLSEYGVKNAALVAAANRYYNVLRGMMGSALPDVCSHSKYILFSR